MHHKILKINNSLTIINSFHSNKQILLIILRVKKKMYYYLFQFDYYSLKKIYLHNNYSDKIKIQPLEQNIELKLFELFKLILLKDFK